MPTTRFLLGAFLLPLTLFATQPLETITVTIHGKGDVTPPTGNYVRGSQVMLQGTPAPGYTFSSWRITTADGWTDRLSAQETITVTNSTQIEAFFSPPLTIYFQDDTGQLAMWKGTADIISENRLLWPLGVGNRIPLGWTIVDMTRSSSGSGFDILWSGPSGYAGTWKTSDENLALVTAETLDTGDRLGRWKPVAGPYALGTNGQSIIWYNAEMGRFGTWTKAPGAAVWSYRILDQLPLAPTGWEFGKFMDFNHDGLRDFFWYNPTSQRIGSWNLDGELNLLSISNDVTPWNLTGSYLPTAVFDLEGDGFNDIILQSRSYGTMSVLSLNPDFYPVVKGTAGAVMHGLPRQLRAEDNGRFLNFGANWKVVGGFTSP